MVLTQHEVQYEAVDLNYNTEDLDQISAEALSEIITVGQWNKGSCRISFTGDLQEEADQVSVWDCLGTVNPAFVEGGGLDDP